MIADAATTRRITIAQALAKPRPVHTCEAVRTGGLDRNKVLIRAHYEATTNHFDPAAIDKQVADSFFDHAAGAPLGPLARGCADLTSWIVALPDNGRGMRSRLVEVQRPVRARPRLKV